MKKFYLFFIACALLSCKKEKGNIEIEVLPIQDKELTILVNDSLSTNPIIMGDSLEFSLHEKQSLQISKYLWILNGATPSTSNLANPKVKYKTEGSYDVKLIVTRGGKTDTLFMPKLVKVESTIIKGLMAYYPFNGNAKDMSGNGFDGTPNNAVLTTDRFGNQNAAYLFNGTSSSIIIRDKPALRLSQTDFTINLWLKLDNYDQSFVSSLLIKRYGGSNNGWLMSVTGYGSIPNFNSLGSAFFNVSGGGDPYAVGHKKIDLNTWCMLTTVYSFEQRTLSFYINGKLDKVTSNIPSPNGNINADLLIGSDNRTGTPGYYIKGKIDDIGFYDRMLTKQEINRIYFNSEASAPPVFDK